jgi:hypothetical protein
MQTKPILILGLLGVFCFSGLGMAGVYNPDLKEQAKNPPQKLNSTILTSEERKLTPKELEEELRKLRSSLDAATMEPTAAAPLPFNPPFQLALDAQMEIPDTKRNTLFRRFCLERVEELRKKIDADPDDVTDRVSLSAYAIRLGRPEEAVQLLEGLARGAGRSNFMVAANLGTAYLLMGDLQRADDYAQQARSVWPSEWPGLSKEQLTWYKEAEAAQLKLIRVRRRALLAAGKAEPAKKAENLFGVNFGDEEALPLLGASTVGLMPAPLAQGPLLAAATVVPGRIVTYEAGSMAAAEKEKLPANAFAITEQLLLWLPGDGALYWLLGELLNAQGDIDNAQTVLDQCANSRGMYALQLIRHRQVLAEAIAQRNQARSTPSPSWVPDKDKLILVGGGIGVVVVFLAYLQVREARRRKHGEPGHGEPGA